VFEMAAPIQSPAKCVPSYDFSTQNLNAREGDAFLGSIVTGDETWGFQDTPESKQAGKKFDDDDEVQEDVMTWFNGPAADCYDSEI
jgi:hypothetical protein